jgi:hypothetical protein
MTYQGEAQASSEVILKEILDTLRELLREAIKIRIFMEQGFNDIADESTEDKV